MKKILLKIIGVILIAIIIGLIIYLANGNIQVKPKLKEVSYNIREEKFIDRNVFILTPQKEKTEKIILYLHGGAYTIGLEKEHWRFFDEIIKDTKATIIVPDYPLLPQYNYEDVFNMVMPLYEKIISSVEKKNLVLMGDSAGGGMSLALIQKAAENKLTQPSKTILISPWLDVTMENEKIEEVQKNDKKLNKSLLKVSGILYAKSEENTKNYLVSPIYGKLEKIENIVIYTGTNDILNPDVHILKEKLESKGVNIKVIEFAGAIHNWILEKYIDEKYNDNLAKDAYQNLIYELNN